LRKPNQQRKPQSRKENTQKEQKQIVNYGT